MIIIMLDLVIDAVACVHQTCQATDFERRSSHPEEAFFEDVQLQDPANAGSNRDRNS